MIMMINVKGKKMMDKKMNKEETIRFLRNVAYYNKDLKINWSGSIRRYIIFKIGAYNFNITDRDELICYEDLKLADEYWEFLKMKFREKKIEKINKSYKGDK